MQEWLEEIKKQNDQREEWRERRDMERADFGHSVWQPFSWRMRSMEGSELVWEDAEGDSGAIRLLHEFA